MLTFQNTVELESKIEYFFGQKSLRSCLGLNNPGVSFDARNFAKNCKLICKDEDASRCQVCQVITK